ncbi:hypothetical protein [uncultured Thiodictyon sp.]|uniref:hypothetical protein n=1 Tax=uncultured Thiodictyon sp. TaxID=1846217 RepID=UPI0025ED11FE|nr:hypothetical protein [uncultured Thiodictyon sp.]
MSQSVPAVAADLAQAAAAFARWRASTPMGARIPEALWLRAVEVAATHGVAKVAATLRLDDVRLKRRVMGRPVAAASPPAAATAFVELTVGLPPSGPGCVLVLSNVAGHCLRIEWTRPLASEVAAVARSLWEAAA